jgi:hypothetical protein
VTRGREVIQHRELPRMSAGHISVLYCASRSPRGFHDPFDMSVFYAFCGRLHECRLTNPAIAMLNISSNIRKGGRGWNPCKCMRYSIVSWGDEEREHKDSTSNMTFQTPPPRISSERERGSPPLRWLSRNKEKRGFSSLYPHKSAVA